MTDNKPITQQAKLQAAIIALIKSTSDPWTSGDLAAASAIQELNLRQNVLYATVSNMSNAGLLRKVHITRPDQPQAKFAYEIGNAIAATVHSKRSRAAVTTYKAPRGANKESPFASIDLVQSTGKIRITFKGGITIDIGITEA